MARIGLESRFRSDAMSNDPIHTAPTLFLLMAQYQGRTVISPWKSYCGKALRGGFADRSDRTKPKGSARCASDGFSCVYRQKASRRFEGMPSAGGRNLVQHEYDTLARSYEIISSSCPTRPIINCPHLSWAALTLSSIWRRSLKLYKSI
jgi:hypothetical protein